GFDWLSIPGIDNSNNGTNNNSHSTTATSSLNASGVPYHIPAVRFDIASQNPQEPLESQHTSQITQTTSQQDQFNNIFDKLKISNPERMSQSDDNISIRYQQEQKANHTTGSSLLSSSYGNPVDLPTRASSTDTLINPEESNVSLSLTINDLSKQEAKTYLRWYNNILARKNGEKTITLEDVFRFLCNFKISDAIRERIKDIFKRAFNLNIGQFFALLRLLAHAIEGKSLTKTLIRVQAAIPKPVSIMSRKRLKDDVDSNATSEEASINENSNGKPQHPLDLDSFTQFLLTGERPSESPKKKSRSGKKVKFSDEVTIEPSPIEPTSSASSTDNLITNNGSSALDLSLPMDQLLSRTKSQNTGNSNSNSFITSRTDENEEEELKDMQESMNHFQNVTIDSVSLHGTPANVPGMMFNNNNMDMQLSPGVLSPMMTGNEQQPPTVQPLAPNLTGSVSKSMRENHYFTMLGRERASSSPIPFLHNPRVSSPLSRQDTSSVDNANQFLQAALNDTPAISLQQPQNSNGITKSLPPPPPPPSRSRAGTSPSFLRPPAPPPPRSRKNSSPPALENVHTGGNTIQNHSRPVSPSLPPKPLLTNSQRQHYISPDILTPSYTG
ncbi:hypothetical protein CANARDRAFT_180422, partial [[Candida] arabinofermentans NRRL YB-2248]